MLPSYRSFPPEIKAQIQNERRDFSRQLIFAQRHLKSPVAGFYGPDSMMWRIYREPYPILGGIRALLLQVAHPAVACGVEHNSNFRGDFLGRARRTFQSTYQLIFGSATEALGAAQRLHNLHARVRGMVDNDEPRPFSGCPYHATDPELLLWVFATLVDTTFVMAEQVHQPLTIAEKTQAYDEFRVQAALCGIPQAVFPKDLPAFNQYMTDMIDNHLAVGDVGLSLADALFNSPYTRSNLDEILTIGMLSPRLRTLFQLEWNDKLQRRHERLLAGIRLLMRIMPASMRYVPAYHQAQLRIARSQNQRGTFWARGVNWLDHRLGIPLSIHPIAPTIQS